MDIVGKHLHHPVFWALKAGIGAVLALWFDLVLSNPDHISSVFICCLATSPLISVGISRSRTIMIGAFIGAFFTAPFLWYSVNHFIVIPIAVLLVVYIGARFIQYIDYGAIAFSPIFLYYVQFDNPLNTLRIRVLAPAIGCFSSLLVTFFVSFFVAEDMYKKRFTSMLNGIVDDIVKHVETKKALSHVTLHIHHTSINHLVNELILGYKEGKVRKRIFRHDLDGVATRLLEYCYALSHFLNVIGREDLSIIDDELQKSILDILEMKKAPDSNFKSQWEYVIHDSLLIVYDSLITCNDKYTEDNPYRTKLHTVMDHVHVVENLV
ncbi:hypothetical protein PCE1_000112 [Barthelona sp. PCE]